MDFKEINIKSLIHTGQQNYPSSNNSSKKHSFLDLVTSDVARDNYIYLQSIGEFHFEHNFVTERKNLHSYFIMYTISGQGRLLYEGKEYMLNKNQLFFIDCNNYQKYEMWNCDTWYQLWLHAYGGNIANYYDLFTQDGSPICTLSESCVIPNLIRQLYEFQRPITKYTELITSKKMVELLTELIIAKDNPHSETAEVPDYILSVQQLFEQDYSNNFTLEYLAKRYAVNKYRLAKEFKKSIGISPIDYLINKRISMAQQLLRNTNESIVAIACLVGIPNVNNFIILFKKRTGLTPLVYRKKW